MPGPAPSFYFLGDQCCESMWKRELQLTLLPRDIHTIPFFSWSHHPPQTETGCEGWGKGEKDFCPLELEGGRIFGGCLTHSSIPSNSSSLLEKGKKKKKGLLFTVSVNPCWFLAALGVNGIFMGKDLTNRPFRYQQSKFLYSNCLWSHSLLNSLTSIKVGLFD